MVINKIRKSIFVVLTMILFCVSLNVKEINAFGEYTINGIVKNTYNGDLSGANAYLYDSENEFRKSVSINSDGSFSMVTGYLNEGNYRIDVEKQGYHVASKTITLNKNNTVVNAETFYLDPATIEITLNVKNASSYKDCSFFYARIRQNNKVLSEIKKSSDTLHFKGYLPEINNFSVSIVVDGNATGYFLEPMVFNVSMEPGGRYRDYVFNKEIVFKREDYSVYGTISDENEERLSDVKIELLDFNKKKCGETKTNTNGEYRFNGVHINTSYTISVVDGVEEEVRLGFQKRQSDGGKDMVLGNMVVKRISKKEDKPIKKPTEDKKEDVKDKEEIKDKKEDKKVEDEKIEENKKEVEKEIVENKEDKKKEDKVVAKKSIDKKEKDNSGLFWMVGLVGVVVFIFFIILWKRKKDEEEEEETRDSE